MALSGSFTNYFQGNASRFHMTTTWSAVQNIANNTSTITAITTIRPEGAFSATASKNGSITIAGNRKNFTFVLGSVAAGTTKEVGRHTVTVSHASNGTGSAAISSTLDINITYSGANLGSLSTSGTATLNTIARASSIGTISGNQIGSSITVNISRSSTSFTHRVYYHLPGQEWQEVATAATTSSTFTIPGSDLSFIPNATSGQLRIMIRTYSGGTRIGGDITKYHTVYVPTSTFTIPTSFTMGNAFAVSISRVGPLTHEISLHDGTTALYWSGNNVTTSGSVDLALSTLAARSPNAMSKVFTVRVSTYNGSTPIGNVSKNITANVPTSLKPTFGAVTASENVSTVTTLVGAYVQTKSKLNLAITGASGIHGSTIKSYNITGVGHNVNSSSTVTGLLSVSGNQTIKGTIIDSRGQSFEKSIVVNILPYTAPTLSGLSFRRTLPDKTEVPLGDNATVRASVKVQSLIVNGVQKNSIKYNVQSAQSGGSFADKENTTSTDLTKSYSDVWVGYSVDHAYNFRVRAGDVFGFGGWSVGVIPTGVVTQQWGSKTTSFGKMIDNTSYNVQVGVGGIQSDGPIIDKNGIEVPGVKPIPGNNLNNAMAPGFYYWTTGVTNAPVDYGSMVVTAWDGDGRSTAEQLVIKNNSMWIRAKNNSAGAWSDWTMVSKDGHTHVASDITSGTFADARIPNLNASKITAGTIADARLPAKSKPTDFVEQQGSNYKKWNSGDLEVWGRATGSSIAASYATCSANLPIALSTVSGALITGTVAGLIAGQPASIYNSTMNSTSKVTFSLWKLTTGNFAAGTNNVIVDYYIRGRWK